MVVVYGDHAPSPTAAFEWVCRFKNGQLNNEDNLSCDRPITATDGQTGKAVAGLIIEGSRITVQQIAYAVGVSTYTAHGIIHD